MVIFLFAMPKTLKLLTDRIKTFLTNAEEEKAFTTAMVHNSLMGTMMSYASIGDHENNQSEVKNHMIKITKTIKWAIQKEVHPCLTSIDDDYDLLIENTSQITALKSHKALPGTL
jgi:hypothetical protein